MSGYGVPQDDIACMLDIAPKTLREHFRRELDVGIAKANARIGQTLFQQATGGNTAAAIFWAKARMGWREKIGVEHSGADGAAIQLEVTSARERIASRLAGLGASGTTPSDPG